MDILDFYKQQSVIDDFDDEFYALTYKETERYYQPFCTNNNISDRERLYYHYINFGRKQLYKKNEEDTIIPYKICKRKKNNAKLAVITSFYNPCNYINLQYNYDKFVKHIESYANLFSIELSFDGNFYTKNKNALHIKGNENNILWQKERLLNILLKQIPEEYTDIAWVDCDIIFDDIHWLSRLYNLLEYYKVVQLYDSVNRKSNMGINTLKSTGVIKNLSNGVSGFGWAIRRDSLTKINGLLDNQILGGADYLMSRAFINMHDCIEEDRAKQIVDKENTYDWMKVAAKEIDGSVYYLNGTITHLYHGDISNRYYTTRYKKLNKLDFKNDVHRDDNDLWTIDTKYSKPIYDYFLRRNEDDNVVFLNEYFDNIYVLNLDKDTTKLENISEKLDKYNIQFTRFSAVDGNIIEFDDNQEFIHGHGNIENRYALACLLSHKEIIKDAINKQYNKILILEDDVMISPDFQIHLQNIRDIKEWKMLYLGGSQYNWQDIQYVLDNNFYYSKQTYGTFAYAIDKSLFDEILNFNTEKAIDHQLTALQESYYRQCYTFYPNIFISDVNSSSIRKQRKQYKHNIDMRWNLYQYE